MKYKYFSDNFHNRLLINIRALFWYKKNNPKIPWKKCNSIAIVYPFLIGDIVMATPFFRKLREIAPQAKITFIGASWAKQFLGTQNLVDEFICFKDPFSMSSLKAMLKNWKDIIQTLKKARKKTFDIVIDPFGNPRATLFMSFLHATHYIGAGFSNLHKLQTFTIPYEPQSHFIDILMRLFKYTGYNLKEQDSMPKIVLSDEQIKFGQNFIAKHKLKDKIILGIHPGASRPSKRWPKFAQTINLLCQTNWNMTICLFCGPGDEAFVKDILAKVNISLKDRVIIVKQNIMEYISILSICNHVICNDSSCGHISAALGVPVTVLFGHADPRFIAPRGNSIVNILSKDFPCKPCLKNKCPKHTQECFT